MEDKLTRIRVRDHRIYDMICLSKYAGVVVAGCVATRLRLSLEVRYEVLSQGVVSVFRH